MELSLFSKISDMYGSSQPDKRLRADSRLAFDLEQQIVGIILVAKLFYKYPTSVIINYYMLMNGLATLNQLIKFQ